MIYKVFFFFVLCVYLSVLPFLLVYVLMSELFPVQLGRILLV